MKEEPHVSMVVCSAQMMCATGLLNGNAFPQACATEVQVAARRLAILLQNTSIVNEAISKAAQEFFLHLSRNWESYTATIRARHEDLKFIAYSDGLRYMSAMHNILYEFKAFLDLYTRLLTKLISPMGGGPVMFNKGPVAGIDISGGRLINWIRGFSTEVLPLGGELSNRIYEASRDWITPAVDFRDALGHFRELPGFCHMRISVSDGPTTISLHDIQAPRMPDGQLLGEYGQILAEKLCQLVENTMPLLPMVQANLLESWESAKKYLYR